MGGGTVNRAPAATDSVGLSPRGRGNRFPLDSRGRRLRSIPAWAGEPPAASCPPAPSWVYPRVGGGTSSQPTPRRLPEGLSPRGRGNLCGQWLPSLVHGSTSSQPTPRRLPEGLSPRGRGNLCGQWLPSLVHGSIPAWAGEPLAWLEDYAKGKVYPRVGGGTAIPPISGCSPTGLSPRGRGNHLCGQPCLKQ